MKKKRFFKIRFSLILILLCIAILYFDGFIYFAEYALVVALHELAHFVTAKKLGYKLSNFYLMPYGVCLNYDNNVFAGNDEIIISLAGPFLNYLLCVLCVALWWLFPETYYYLDYFCFCNLVLGTFNMLPCFPLDGGRAFTCMLSKTFERSKASKMTLVCNYVISSVLVVAFVISLFFEPNFSFLFVAIFLFCGCINTNKYSNYTYISLGTNRDRIFEKGSKVNIFAIKSNVKLFKIMAKFSKYRFNIVYVVLSNGAVKVLSENNISNLAIKYSPSLSIEEIMEEM